MIVSSLMAHLHTPDKIGRLAEFRKDRIRSDWQSQGQMPGYLAIVEVAHLPQAVPNLTATRSVLELGVLRCMPLCQ